MRFTICLAAALALPAAGLQVHAAAAQAQSPQAAVDELLAADRTFAKASAGVELADGIGAMLDSESVMPAPGGFVRGKDAIIAALMGNPANIGARAVWTPIRGGVSADGEQGFTIGFMSITANGQAERRAKYVSYWIRKPEGWRVAVYKRAPRPDGEVSTQLLPASLPSQALKATRDPATLETYRASLDRAERGFSDDAQVIGIGPAFVKHGSPDATNVGIGAGFTVGNENIGADLGSFRGPAPSWAPDGGLIVAATGDLGITWGLIRAKQTGKDGAPVVSPYTTVWRRVSPQVPWRYIAE